MVININTIGEQISLSKGQYTIDIIGGWGIKLNDFSIQFQNIKTEEFCTATRSSWPIQSYWHERRCKRISNIYINEEGLYEVVFSNTDSLVVRHSPLRTLMHRLFASPVSNEHIEVRIK